MEIESIDLLIVGGLVLGLILGIILQHSKFCMAAIVSNFVLMRDYRQLHAYLAAVIVAVSGTQFLNSHGIINLNNSSYISENIDWFGAILGGLCFGVGSIFAGGCIGRSIVRFGEGNLGAIIVLIAIGISGSATMFGILEPFRLWLISFSSNVGDANNSSITSILNISTNVFTFFVVLVSLSLLFLTGRSNRSVNLVLAGVAIGFVIILGWWFTGSFTQNDFSSVHNPASVTYAGPISNVAFIVSTGSELGDGAYFGIFLLLGTVIGSFFNAIRTHSFHVILPETHHLQHLIFGGLLMGFGAVLAGGCNIGQGLTGLSTYSVKSIVSIVAIIVGMRVGLVFLLRTEAMIDRKSTTEKYGLLKIKSLLYRFKGIHN